MYWLISFNKHLEMQIQLVINGLIWMFFEMYMCGSLQQKVFWAIWNLRQNVTLHLLEARTE